MYRYFKKNRTHRYIDVLSAIVDNYNSTPHRSLTCNGLAPNKVTKKNEADVWAVLYLKKSKTIKKPKLKGKFEKLPTIKYRYKINDMVRLSHLKHVFRIINNLQVKSLE